MNSDYKYFAFISYSHRDARWSDWLHRKLETFRIPKHLNQRAIETGKTLPARIFPVFRDREELPTSSTLSEQIQAALKQSRYLIVICSPRAANSRWVNEEIIEFKRLGYGDRILSLIVDGEPNAGDKPGVAEQECFPPALRFEINDDGTLSDQRTEPIAADARPGGDGKGDALLKLVAGLLEVGFDVLKQRAVRRKQQRLIALTSFAVFVTLLTSALALTAVIARAEAERQRRRAEQTLSQSDYLHGARLIAEDRAMDGLAHLARSVRVDPSNRFAADAILANLVYRTWPIPLGEATSWEQSDGMRAVLSHDSTELIISTRDDPVRVYNRKSGKELARIDVFDGPYGLTLHSERDLLAIWNGRGDYRIYQPSNGEAVTDWFRIKAYTGVCHSGFSADGKWFAAAAGPSGFFVWPVRSKPGPPSHLDQPLDTVVFADDDTAVLSANTNLVQAWEFSKGRLTRKIGEDINIGAPVQRAILLGDDASEAVIATWRGDLAVWDLNLVESFQEPLALPHKIRDMVISEDENDLLVAYGKEVRVLDAVSLDARSEPALHKSEVIQARFIDGTRGVATVAFDRAERLVIQEWDFRPGALLPDEINFPYQVEDAAFAGLSRRLLVRAENNNAYVLALNEDGQAIPIASFGTDHLKALVAVLSPGGNQVLSVTQKQAVQLHTLIADQVESRKISPTGPVSTAAFSPDGSVVFLGYSGGQGELRDTNSRAVIGDTISLGGTPRFAVFGPAGQTLALTTEDNDVQLWMLAGDPPSQLARVTFDAQVNTLSFDATGSMLACAIGDVGKPGEVQFLDTSNGQHLAASLEFPEGVHALALDQSAKRIAVSVYDGRVQIWDIFSGVPVTPPLQHAQPALALRFIDSDSALLTVSASGKLRRWRLPNIGDASAPDWLPQLAEVVGRRAMEEHGVLRTLSQQEFANAKRHILALDREEALAGWAHWILDDRSTRASPPAAD